MNELIIEREKKQNCFDYTEILNREHIANEITNMLETFDKRCSDVQFKKGIYILRININGKMENLKVVRL